MTDPQQRLATYRGSSDKEQWPDLRPDRWTVRTVLERLATVGDPLAPLVGRHQQLPKL